VAFKLSICLSELKQHGRDLTALLSARVKVIRVQQDQSRTQISSHCAFLIEGDSDNCCGVCYLLAMAGLLF